MTDAADAATIPSPKVGTARARYYFAEMYVAGVLADAIGTFTRLYAR